MLANSLLRKVCTLGTIPPYCTLHFLPFISIGVNCLCVSVVFGVGFTLESYFLKIMWLQRPPTQMFVWFSLASCLFRLCKKTKRQMSWMKMQIYSLTLGGAFRKENSCSGFCIPKTKYKRARKDSYLWIVFYVPAADLGKRVHQKSGCLLGLSFLSSEIGWIGVSLMVCECLLIWIHSN